MLDLGRFPKIVVESNNLPQQISEQLRELIMHGELSSGDRLPPERDLAVALNVSRGALREATRLLEAAGIVQTRHGRGTFIASVEPKAVMSEALTRTSPSFDAKDLADLYQMRRVLESEAAASAAQRVRPRDVKRLLANCDETEKLVASGAAAVDRFSALHADFHRAIVELSGNAIMARVMDGLMDLLAESRRYTIRRTGRTERTCAEHRRIGDAIARKNAAAARKAMFDHIVSVEMTAFARRRTPTAP